jgi:hypothetical protein
MFTNLALVYRERPLKVIVLTSPLPGDGKTLTATDFALVGASPWVRHGPVGCDTRSGTWDGAERH